MVMVMQQQRRRDGRLSQHAYGGLYGKREIRGVLKKAEWTSKIQDELCSAILFLVLREHFSPSRRYLGWFRLFVRNRGDRRQYD